MRITTRNAEAGCTQEGRGRGHQYRARRPQKDQLSPPSIQNNCVTPVALVCTHSEIPSELCTEIARGLSGSFIRESIICHRTQSAYCTFSDDHTGILLTQSSFMLAATPRKSWSSHLQAGSSRHRGEPWSCSSDPRLPLPSSAHPSAPSGVGRRLLLSVSVFSHCLISLTPTLLPSLHHSLSLCLSHQQCL